MNLETTRLLLFVRDAISPNTFNGTSISEDTLLTLKSNFQQELTSLQMSFYYLLNSKQQSDREVIFNQLVAISDTINTYLCRSSAQWKNHPQASVIKSIYLFTLNTLDKLIDELGKMDLCSFEQVKISDFRLSDTTMLLKEQFRKLKQHLKNVPVDEELRKVMYGTLSQYIRKKKLATSDFNYVQSLITFLLAEQQITTKRLMELLVILDFSGPEFLLYYLETWKRNLLNLDSLHDQLEMTLMEIDNMNFLSFNTRLQRPGGVRPLYEELGRYLHEKQEMISQLIVLRREFLKDQRETVESTRFQINMPVAQLGLLIRLLLEKGVLVKENLGELFSFFAAHFYTPKTLYISAESLQKKSSDIEFSTALKLKALLIGMLNYLNANFNLSNYSV